MNIFILLPLRHERIKTLLPTALQLSAPTEEAPRGEELEPVSRAQSPPTSLNK